MTDTVNHPSHYADKKIEVIKYLEDTLTNEEYIGFCVGNVIKYVSRWRKKGGAEDLKKAKVYLEWAIAACSEKAAENPGGVWDGFEEALHILDKIAEVPHEYTY